MKNDSINRIFISPQEYVDIMNETKEGQALYKHLKDVANNAMKNYKIKTVIAQVDTLLYITDESDIPDDIRQEREDLLDRDLKRLRLL